MLVLTVRLRRSDPDAGLVYLTFRDGTEVQVRLVGIDSGRVKLGFDAPQDVAIERAVLRRGKDARRRAAG